jgi:hypothetical protein
MIRWTDDRPPPPKKKKNLEKVTNVFEHAIVAIDTTM